MAGSSPAMTRSNPSSPLFADEGCRIPVFCYARAGLERRAGSCGLLRQRSPFLCWPAGCSVRTPRAFARSRNSAPRRPGIVILRAGRSPMRCRGRSAKPGWPGVPQAARRNTAAASCGNRGIAPAVDAGLVSLEASAQSLCVKPFATTCHRLKSLARIGGKIGNIEVPRHVMKLSTTPNWRCCFATNSSSATCRRAKPSCC